MRSYRPTVILFIVLVVTISGFILLKDTKSSEVSNTIYKLEDKSITKINIKSDSGIISLSKNGESWEMSQPNQYQVDQDSINRLSNMLENLAAIRVIEKDADDLSRYGLDQPKMTVEFKTQDEKENILYIGMKTASNYQVYARDSRSKIVYTVSLTDLEVLGNGNSSEFRDRNFLSIDKHRVNSLFFDINGKRELSLTEYETGKWQFTQPCRVNAKNDVIREKLKGITELKIKDFIQDETIDLEKYGLINPSYTLTLGDKSGKTQTINFGKSDESKKEIFVKIEGEQRIFSLSTETFNPKEVKIGDLINETPLSIGIDKINKIIIDDKGITSEFNRDISKSDNVFTYKGRALDNDSFIALYVDMMALAADGYDAGNNEGYVEMTITYEMIDNGGSVKMELSKRNDTSYFITVDKKPLPFYVSGNKVELVRRWLKRVIQTS